MALGQRMDIRQVLAAAVFAATTSIASPLYLAVLSEQTASDADWLAVAETLAERHGDPADREPLESLGTIYLRMRPRKPVSASASPPRLSVSRNTPKRKRLSAAFCRRPIWTKKEIRARVNQELIRICQVQGKVVEIEL